MARILVVDDDESMRDVIHDVLTRGGFEVNLAENAADAERLLNDVRPFDLVVTDVFMPAKDGLRFLARLRRQPVRPKVIVICGAYSGEGWSTLTVAGALGADATLGKPFRGTELLHLVRQHLAA